MAAAGTITASKTRDPYKSLLQLSSHHALFPPFRFFIAHIHNLCIREKIVDMPMNLFMRPQMPLYPLIQTIQT